MKKPRDGLQSVGDILAPKLKALKKKISGPFSRRKKRCACGGYRKTLSPSLTWTSRAAPYSVLESRPLGRN
jgi:hypothetical protein